MAKAIKTPDHGSRAHALLSASSAHRWLKCTMAPFAELLYPDKETPYTAEGTAAHEIAQIFAEIVAECGADYGKEIPAIRQKLAAMPDCTAEMLDCAEGYAAFLAEHIKDDSTAILAEQRLDYSKWVPEGFGTGDCIIISDGTLTVTEYKYGQGVAVSAKDNPQMQLYALGAIDAYSCIYDFDKVQMAIYQPRMNNVSEATVSVDDLLRWAKTELVTKAAEAYSGAGTYSPGEHCRFCKHAHACRAFAEKCCEFAEHHGLRVAIPKLTDAEYLEFFRRKKTFELWLKKIEGAITDRMLAGEKIAGLKLVSGRSAREWTDTAAVVKALEAEHYSPDEYMTAPELLSPAALEKSLGKKTVANLLADLIEVKPGKPTPAEEDDKRPEFNPGADFENLDQE
ncbi:MAG: DUF2800 domain-containing protein [Clostridia bacterium]|nr:DUF2800 domain-containing protein [Clostridia bacterium]